MKWIVTVVGGNVRLYFSEHYWIEFRVSEKAKVEEIADQHNRHVDTTSARAKNEAEIAYMMGAR